MSEKTISWLERGDALITRRSSGSALETLANFAQRGLLEQDPPRWLLEFTSGDLEYYLHGHTDPLST